MSAPTGFTAAPATTIPADVRLYVIPGSHACRTGMLLLEHKSVPFRTVELPTGMHPFALRALGFPGNRRPIRSVDGATHRQLASLDRLGTVPALRFGEQRIQTSTSIVELLEQRIPEPPLYPDDADLRARVEEARRFGDEPLQMAARRVVLAAATEGLEHLHAHGREGRLGALLHRRDSVRSFATYGAARFTFRAGPQRSAELAAAVPPMLDRIDAWVQDSVLNAEQLNAADLTIVPSLALLDYRLDLREDLRARPSYALLERVLPEPA